MLMASQNQARTGSTPTELRRGAFPKSGPMPQAVAEYHTSEAKARELLVSSLSLAFPQDANASVDSFVSQLTIPPDSLVFSLRNWPRPTQVYVISRDLFSKLKERWSPRVHLAADSVLEGKKTTSASLERICWKLEDFATLPTSPAYPGGFFVAVVDIKKSSREIYLSRLNPSGTVVCKPLVNPDSLKE
ncbi:Uncharacterised protein [Candidatus Bilamarchaeum dharawalense]|uniref:Uncharacterized protein n=1 Tax=Candidatus Bilamarchaeum dharawalense TaxID=2885759 RepID=A0A5E4LYA6_9ARCH|nr:Uncharacterised protein [Candidatus Bilamarchaeum dharawalense]